MDAADTIRTSRASAGLTQRALAAASGVTQPRIAAYESGRVVPTADSLQRLLDACKVRPSLVLERHRDVVLGMISEAGGREPRVFGSVARGEDEPGSDIDLLVRLPEGMSLLELVELEQRLEDLLGVPVDIVDDRANGRVLSRARAEAVTL